MKSTDKNSNYLLQSNFFTQSVMRGVTEMQKDIIYYLQTLINFRDPNPEEEIIFNYNKFLEYKNVKKNSFYSVSELLEICSGLIHINGVFYNTQTKITEFFNVIDSVSVSDEDANEFIVRFAKWGKIFFYEKHALEYANKTRVQYTQIESSIIDLKGDKRKKLFELLSQFKATGIYRVSLEELKVLLGFIVYKNEKNKSETTKQLQLKFLFDTKEISPDYERVEYLARWSEFKRVFLDPAINDFNSNEKLDISHISYETVKVGRKITNLHFKFQKRLDINNLSEVHQTALKSFLAYGLTESQILFLLQRIGQENMFNRFNKAVTFNQHYDNKESKFIGKRSGSIMKLEKKLRI
ncbi:replication initiation protein [Chryseobacterium taklimakanense]|uniref:RepB family plasmid replication initiator protein n=1 Tax=Chryseobacterium taklimakanense TaxID=536441 RepID=A0A3G8WMK4_9FLAO|nr:replication initiation protein [Chryseobacterium taklimakanense]AZI21518.1 RepB family plasmid replication initiator protein [Chryseobacterium taklimakanense]